MAKVWMITGCSEGGMGEWIARAALDKGERVLVTARDLKKVESIVKDYPDLAMAVSLDLTNDESIRNAVNIAEETWGGVDVLINNAGYAYRSSIEEAEADGMMRMYQTNLFGPIALIQKVLPSMRKKGAGTIVNISSIAAVRTGPASGFYASSKAALELMSEGLAAECKPLGIRVMVVEPGSFRTHFYDSSLQGSKMTIDAYKETAWTRSVENSVNQHNQPGDPKKLGQVLVNVLERDELPFKLLLGSDAVKVVKGTLEKRLQEIDAWAEVSQSTDY